MQLFSGMTDGRRRRGVEMRAAPGAAADAPAAPATARWRRAGTCADTLPPADTPAGTAAHTSAKRRLFRPRLWVWLVAVLAAATVQGVAGSDAAPDPALVRRSAEDMARLGAETRDPVLLIGALTTMLGAGATLADDDPWDAARYLALLQEISAAQGGRYDDQIARLTGSLRGTASGPSRYDIALAPGERASFGLTVVQGENAIIEARLKRGSDGGDIDLEVLGPDGRELASDRGPASGIPGIGVYAEFRPVACQDVTVVLVNVGDARARLALIAPPALDQDCER